MSVRLNLLAGSLAAACFACDDGGDSSADATPSTPDAPATTPDAPASALTVNGSVVGESVPANAKVIAVWFVSSGSPDYAYKFGDGTSSGASFVLTMTTDPPSQAINSYGVGVGFIALAPSDAENPEGEIDDDAVVELLGISARHAIIWKESGAAGLGWVDAFPAGFACGQCVPAAGGETFDHYAPTDCSLVQIDVTSEIESLDVCNWT